MTEDEWLFDDSIRTAFLDCGIIAENVAKAAAALSTATSETIRLHMQSVGAQLRGLWGADFQGNLDWVDEYVTGLADKHPAVALLLDHAPYLIAGDVMTMDQLLRVAQ